MAARLRNPSVQAFSRRQNGGSQAEQAPKDMGIMPVAAHIGEIIPLNQFILCNYILGINSSL
jgi:hypothetical protein